MKKNVIVSELRREMEMREKVWETVRLNPTVFKRYKHQEYYDRLAFAADILDSLSLKEWENLCARRERNNQPPTADTAQTSLF